MKKILTTLLVLWAAPSEAGDARLSVQIAEAHHKVPQAFAAVEQIRADVLKTPPPVERRALVARAMKALGPDALFPLVELVQHGLPQAPPRARATLLVGALEALRDLRDRRALPVLAQVLDGPEADRAVVRAAAEALGATGADEAAALLVARARPGAPRDREALAGLGFCRRPLASEHLSARLRAGARGELATVEALAEAAGFHGSSWAWEALGPARATEGDETRARLAAALVDALAQADGAARPALGRALLMVDHPSTPNRLAALRASAGPALAADLQTLETRWLRLRRR